jgi:thioredoxin reductase (NADPH)
MTHAKVLIIGAGPAGYTAAIYAARAGLAPLLVAGPQPGGQLMITTDVENYPGFADAVTGPDLMAAMRAQAERVGTALAEDTITGVALGARPFTAHGAGGAAYTGDALIIATGAKARWLGLESEAAFQGRGVSACATCDGFFFRGQDVAVVGGGNSAVEEALYLAGICRSVTLVHRRDTLRAEKILQARLFARENVAVRWNSVVEEITGDASGVTGVRLDTGEVLLVTGVFIAIGHDPATAPFRGAVDMDGEGYIRVAPGTTRTSVPGVFAAGDVADKVYRQAVTAAGLGCMAALEAEKFLAR